MLEVWNPVNFEIPFLPPTEPFGHLPSLATRYVLLVRGTEGVPPQTAPAGTQPRRETLATSPQRTATESTPPAQPD